MSILISDAFTGTDGTTLPAHDAGWVTPYGTDLVIKTNAVACGGAAAICTARYHGVTWPNDQYAQAVVVAVASGQMAVMVRHTTAVAITYYGAGIDPADLGHGRYAIWKDVSGTVTSLYAHASQTPTAGDVVKLRVSGTTLTLSVNGIDLNVGGTTDATLASGEAGINALHSAANVALWDTFEGGDLASGLSLICLGGGMATINQVVGG